MHFDHIEGARELRNLLVHEQDAVWRKRINDAIDYSSTGTEIIVLVRAVLLDLLKERRDLPLDLVTKVNEYIRAADKFLGQ
jgi:hypothetical protein